MLNFMTLGNSYLGVLEDKRVFTTNFSSAINRFNGGSTLKIKGRFY